MNFRLTLLTLMLFGCLSIVNSQCDYGSDESIVLTGSGTINSDQYMDQYILTTLDGFIISSNMTPSFPAQLPGDYFVYGLNYNINTGVSIANTISTLSGECYALSMPYSITVCDNTCNWNLPVYTFNGYASNQGITVYLLTTADGEIIDVSSESSFTGYTEGNYLVFATYFEDMNLTNMFGVGNTLADLEAYCISLSNALSLNYCDCTSDCTQFNSNYTYLESDSGLSGSTNVSFLLISDNGTIVDVNGSGVFSGFGSGGYVVMPIGYSNAGDVSQGFIGQSLADLAIDNLSIGNTACFVYCSDATEYDLSLNKSIDSSDDPLMIGSQITYAITFVNEGSDAVDNIVVIDYLPGSLSLVNDGSWTLLPQTGYATQTLSIANGSLPLGGLLPNESVTVYLTAEITPDVTGTIINTAEIVSFTSLDGELQTDFDSTNDDDNDNDDVDEDDIDIAQVDILGQIGMSVWKDLNGNGIRDGGEPGIAGIQVVLFDCSGNFIATQSSNSAGEYLFDNIEPGDYQLVFDTTTADGDCGITYQNVGSDEASDSDINADGRTECFSIESGEMILDINAGYLQLSSIESLVWEDCNGDGIYNIGEQGIAGVRVNLFNANGILVDYTFTDSDGTYRFDQLYPAQYYLNYTPTGEYEFTLPNMGGNETVDSDVDNSNGLGSTEYFTLNTGEVLTMYKAGLFQCILIGDLVFYDANKNHMYDVTENGINGIKVEVYKLGSSGYSLYSYQYTGHKPGTPSDDGYWQLCVPPGTYYVKYTTPSNGLVPANPGVGIESMDSDLTNANGTNTTDAFTLACDTETYSVAAGFLPQATLGDRVWYDENQNGIQDAYEQGAADILVRAFNMESEVIKEVVTNAQGEYFIDRLQEQEYYLQVLPPDGYTTTIAHATSDDKDSDIDNSNGVNTTSKVLAISDTHIPNIDMGLISNSILSSTWLSIDGMRKANQNVIEWQIANDKDVDFYTIELFDNNDFREIGTVLSQQSQDIETYDYVDYNSSRTGEYTYRVKMVTLGGEISYSTIVVITIGKDIESRYAKLYPNPTINNEVTLEISNNSNTLKDIKIKLYNDLGNLAIAKQLGNIPSNQEKALYKLDISNLPVGVYLVEIFENNQVVSIEKLIIID